jgi:hypothetical protein
MIRFRVMNIIYTEGFRKGLTLKILHISIYSKFFKKLQFISIPFWFMSYNRKYANYIHKVSEQIRNDREKK